MHKRIAHLLRECLPDLADDIARGVSEPIVDFKNQSWPRLAALDAQIPGVGMHFVIWRDWTPLFPFAPEVDGIVRPLSYVPWELAHSPYAASSRKVSTFVGGHVQECVEELCRSCGLKNIIPLGKCVDKYRSHIGEPLSRHILLYCRVSWNTAKHEWHTGLPDSVIPMEDALACYFIARNLGAAVLEQCGRLDDVVEAVANTRRVYNRPEVPSPEILRWAYGRPP